MEAVNDILSTSGSNIRVYTGAGKRPRGYIGGQDPDVEEEESDGGSAQGRGGEKLPDVHGYLAPFMLSETAKIAILRGLANYYATIVRSKSKHSDDEFE